MAIDRADERPHCLSQDESVMCPPGISPTAVPVAGPLTEGDVAAASRPLMTLAMLHSATRKVFNNFLNAYDEHNLFDFDDLALESPELTPDTPVYSREIAVFSHFLRAEQHDEHAIDIYTHCLHLFLSVYLPHYSYGREKTNRRLVAQYFTFYLIRRRQDTTPLALQQHAKALLYYYDYLARNRQIDKAAYAAITALLQGSLDHWQQLLALYHQWLQHTRTPHSAYISNPETQPDADISFDDYALAHGVSPL